MLCFYFFVSVWSASGGKITLGLRVCFVCTSDVCRGAKRLHKTERSKMPFIFSPVEGWFCALAQGRGAHLSTISLPCLPLRASGIASMRFPRQFRGPYGLSSPLSPLTLSIYLSIYLSMSLSLSLSSLSLSISLGLSLSHPLSLSLSFSLSSTSASTT